MFWNYNGTKIVSHKDLPDNCTHIVYELFFTDGTSYIGYKTVRSHRKLQPTKAQLAVRKNYKRVELKDMPFANYTGSSQENKDKVIDYKVILYLTSNKRTATYLEVRELMERRALEGDHLTNKNISGRFFDNCLDGLL